MYTQQNILTSIKNAIFITQDSCHNINIKYFWDKTVTQNRHINVSSMSIVTLPCAETQHMNFHY
jgi:hypothetical protein